MTIPICNDYWAIFGDLSALKVMLAKPHGDGVYAEYRYQLENMRLHLRTCKTCIERRVEYTEPEVVE